jgi:hypothetical protein
MSDPVFERQLMLAILRGNLTREAHKARAQILRDGLTPSYSVLRHYIVQALERAKPRSSIIPWHLPDEVVTRMVGFVVNEQADRD